jgi:hypothetical protein
LAASLRRRCGSKEEGDHVGERIGGVSRGAVLFAVGVLVGMLLLGGGAFTLPWNSEDARAQSSEKWRTQIFEDALLHVTSPGDPDRFLNDWIETLPAECDLGTIEGERGDILVYYRCLS